MYEIDEFCFPLKCKSSDCKRCKIQMHWKNSRWFGWAERKTNWKKSNVLMWNWYSLTFAFDLNWAGISILSVIANVKLLQFCLMFFPKMKGKKNSDQLLLLWYDTFLIDYLYQRQNSNDSLLDCLHWIWTSTTEILAKKNDISLNCLIFSCSILSFPSLKLNTNSPFMGFIKERLIWWYTRAV